jgi:hypothetical protein
LPAETDRTKSTGAPIRRRTSASARADAPVCAASTTIHGVRETISTRAGRTAAASPARAASASRPDRSRERAPHRSHRERGVGGLVPTGRRELRLEVELVLAVAQARRVGSHHLHLELDLASEPRERAAELRGALLDHGERLAGSAPHTAGTPGLRIPAFSARTAASVSPSRSVCSSSMLVIAQTAGDTALVESSRPPRPTSSTAQSTRRSRNKQQRRGSSRVEERGHRLAACGAQRVHVRAQLLHRGREPFRRDLLAVDPEALGPALEVRRGERSHARSRGAQHCLCK